MTESVHQQVTRAMADVFDVPANEVSSETTPETLEAWDSINHLSLVMALEQTFGIAFELDEIPELTTVDAIVGAIEKRAG